tara:strand:- start:439 stop:1146 length:708 start_codon:yes stop_codon:yes gene_type:complete
MVHLGIIPDGNRRWCKKNNKDIDNIINYYENILIEFVNKYKNKKKLPKYFRNITDISFYIASKDNMKRTDKTKDIIFNIIKFLYKIYENPKLFLKKHKINLTEEQLNNIHTIFNQININFIGEIDTLPTEIQNILNKIKKYNKNNKYSLHFAIAYDYYKDIQSYNNSNYKNYIRNQSNIDLILRTGGEFRTSGFFPTKTIYSELFILKKLWPEINLNDFNNILRSFKNRNRRYGK